MRGFFLLLLLTNVAFLGWQYLQRDTQQEVDPYRGISFENKGLTLLSELSPDKRPSLRDGAAEKSVVETVGEETDTSREEKPEKDEKPAAESSAEMAGTPVCYAVRGLDERKTADALITGLRKIGANSIEEGSEQGQDTNYWVMLPPYKSRDKATEAAAILGEKKLKDFFIVRSGDYENAVSLGVFSTRERAKRRYDQVISLKAKLRKPKIEAIKLPVKRYRISWKVANDSQKVAAEALLGRLGLEKSKEIACE